MQTYEWKPSLISNSGHSFAYSIKRHGTTIANCDDEPVHTPGCINDHGLLLTMDRSDLLVSQVSENCPRWTGLNVDQILGRPLAAVIGDKAAQRVRHLLDTEALDNNPLYAMTLRLPGMSADAAPLDLSIHISDGVLILEMEPTGRDEQNAAPTGDYYAMVRRTLSRLRATRTLLEFCDATALEMRRVTALDRVMVYRFHADDSGEIVADAHREDLHSWMGLRYPASDIPKPAREIFKRIGIRPLPDAAGALCEVVPLISPASGRPLDMTFCALRGASTMYTEYLANMGVAATLTMPILRQSELWGMIVCHHYTPTAMPYQLRAAAEFLGQMTSLEMAGAESREHLQYRHRLDSVHHALVSKAAADGDLSMLVEGSLGLLGGIDAGGVAVLQRDRWMVAGRTPTEQQLNELAGWLRDRMASPGNADSLYVSDALSSVYPAAAQFAQIGSGVLAVPVTKSAHGDLVLWFRPEQVQTFSWAGNPHEKPTTVGPNGARLTPRRSFDLWQEQVRGRSLPWTGIEIDSAVRLRFWMIELVASRAEQLSELNTDLARSNDELDAFAYVAGHDLKEPLRGIHKNAYYLMEDAKAGRALDQGGIERIEAVMRLTVRMDNLLDALLHFARVGRLTLEFEHTDLGPVLNEAFDMMGARLLESRVEVRIPRPMPMAWCDRIRVREVLANLLSNAVKYNDKSAPWVEVGYIDADDLQVGKWSLEFSANAISGQRIFYVRDNGIGIDDRHLDRVFAIFKRLHPREAFGGGSGAGLAIAKKLVEQHRGRIWFESAVGVGTTFYFTLPASDDQSDDQSDDGRRLGMALGGVHDG